MPPKAAPTNAERLKKELAAQRARAEALKHLHATGSGPSGTELARQQAERRKLQNATSTRVERFVTCRKAATAQSAADKYDPRVRDNTLHAVALRRANELHATHTETQKLNALHASSSAASNTTDLPDGWTAVPDAASGDMYYWNEHTNETSWDRPRGSNSHKQQQHERSSDATQSTATISDAESLPPGWEAVIDPQSRDVYYWHNATNATSWTRPVAAPAKVSLADALAAKSRLDSILATVGSSSTKKRTASPPKTTTRMNGTSAVASDTKRQRAV